MEDEEFQPRHAAPKPFYETKPTKAQISALGTFLVVMLGAVLTARDAGAKYTFDLFLHAFYYAATGGVVTGSAVFIKTNRRK